MIVGASIKPVCGHLTKRLGNSHYTVQLALGLATARRDYIPPAAECGLTFICALPEFLLPR